jgi:arylsulfatase A-like enzyme
MNDSGKLAHFSKGKAVKEKPNIVYILADDMGYGDLSCLNSESKIRTKHLDRLREGGMAFTDGHSSSAVCTPSRYSILTGRYNWRSTLKSGVSWGYSSALIEEDRLTVPAMLQEQGYRTACFGKWHLGWEWARSGTGAGSRGEEETDVDFSKPIANGPTTKGFDHFFGIPASLDMPPYVYVEDDRPTAIPDRETGDRGMAFWREGPTSPDFVHLEVLPNLTERVVQYIEANKDDPFFVYFPLPAPHTPILPTAEFAGKSGTNAYGDFCLQVDWTVGQVMDALERNGLADNTIVVFAADNGCSPRADFTHLAAMGHHPSYHFRGHKADIYEGGHRIPLLVRWPDGIKPGSACDETVCLVDLMATLAEILGIDLAYDSAEDSVSSLPAWSGRELSTPLREATVHSSVNGSFSIRKGKWKLEMCSGSGGWSYPKPDDEPVGSPPIQLYDLEADISERRNVVEHRPDIVGELRELLTRYVKNGRSTPGARQQNTGPLHWPQLNWLSEQSLSD